MSLEVKIVKGNKALELLRDNTFMARWEELANQSPKVTVIQEPPFVKTWYYQYSNKYQPILVLGVDTNSKVVGLLPLALSIKEKYLTHAGAVQAEYHGWLCQPAYDQDFPIQALIAIKRKLGLKKWQWSWIPPKSKVNWLHSKALRKENIHVRIALHDAPVLDLSDEQKVARLQKNRSIKTKINRYKKKSGLYIERIKTKEKALQVFDVLSSQCDFRQMARYQSAPFANDNNKKPFYIERMNFPEHNHFTILWTNNTPLAFHFGACDSTTVYLGLTSYNPLEERNSPGGILMIKLMELLREEGYRYLDLTPGEEVFKQNYSNLRQKLYKPMFCFSKREKLIADLGHFTRKAIKNSLAFAGAEPGNVKNKLSGNIALLTKNPKVALSKMLRKLVLCLYMREVYSYYKLSVNDVSAINFQSAKSVNINNYEDLLLYNEANMGLSKTELLSQALGRFSSGEILFTIVENEVLVHYGWMTKGAKQNSFSDIDMVFNSHTNSIVLYNFFKDLNCSGQRLSMMIIHKMLTECIQHDREELLIRTSEESSSSIREIENIGFRFYRKFRRVKFLGFNRVKAYDQ